MADNDLLMNLLGLGLGSAISNEQAFQRAKSAQDIVSQKEDWARNYVANLQRQYAPQLAGEVLPSETKYKETQLANLKSTLSEQAAQQEAAMRNKLAAAGMSQSSGLPTGLGQISAAQLKAMAQGESTLDASIQDKINQRMMAAQQIVEGARTSAESVVQSAAADYDKLAAAAKTAGVDYLLQDPMKLVQLARFGVDYVAQISSQKGFNPMDTLQLRDETEPSQEQQIQLAVAGLDPSKVKTYKDRYTNKTSTEGLKEAVIGKRTAEKEKATTGLGSAISKLVDANTWGLLSDEDMVKKINLITAATKDKNRNTGTKLVPPTNPKKGEIFEDEKGRKVKWNGTKWENVK